MTPILNIFVANGIQGDPQGLSIGGHGLNCLFEFKVSRQLGEKGWSRKLFVLRKENDTRR